MEDVKVGYMIYVYCCVGFICNHIFTGNFARGHMTVGLNLVVSGVIVLWPALSMEVKGYLLPLYF